MCGIAGLVGLMAGSQGKPAASMLPDARRMAQALSHRGPDDDGFWTSPDTPVVLAFRRLAIIDLTAEGAQPMHSASGRYVMVYNGEVYNFQTLQAELKTLGQTFRGRSDTEVILAACEQWGLNTTLQKLNGMFALALWDRQERKLHLVRDRMGKKPLYVGWAGQQLLFASELKAFFGCGAFKPVIDREALALYMRYSAVPAPHCIYRGVWQLMPACRLTLDIDRLDGGSDLGQMMEPYWHLPRVVDDARGRIVRQSESATIEEFEGLLRDCVKDRMVADVPLGAFLSGGVDSSTIVALMQQLSDRPVKTYSIGFSESGYDEATQAARIASHLGADHHELYVNAQDAMNVIPQLPDIYDEPFADASQIPTYLVSRFARQDVTVALSGDGGDEMLGGYMRHFMVPHLWSKIGWMPHKMRSSLGAIIRRWPQEHWDQKAPDYPQFGRRLYKFSEMMSARGRDDIYAAQVEQWRDLIVLQDAGRRNSAIPLTDPAWNATGLNFTEQMIYNDLLSYLPNILMVKADRASMAASSKCVRRCWTSALPNMHGRLPLRHKTRREGKSFTGKWLLRQVLARHLPADMYDRPKQGFSVPIEQWLQGPLKDWASELLDKRRMEDAGLLDSTLVTATWHSYLGGQTQHAGRLWTVLMFQAWHERWMRAGGLAA